MSPTGDSGMGTAPTVLGTVLVLVCLLVCVLKSCRPKKEASRGAPRERSVELQPFKAVAY